MGHIGAVVLMTPSLKLLSELFPEAEISVLVRQGTECMLQNFPLIKRIYTSGDITGTQQMHVPARTSLWRRLQQVPRGLKLILALRRQAFWGRQVSNLSSTVCDGHRPPLQNGGLRSFPPTPGERGCFPCHTGGGR